MTVADGLTGTPGYRGLTARTAEGKTARLYWRSVSRWFLIFSLIVASAGLVLYRSAKDSVKSAVTSNLQFIASLKAAQLDGWLDEKENDIRNDMRAEFNRPAFVHAIRQWLRGNGYDPVMHARLLNDLQQISEAHRYLEISLRSGQDGSLLLSSDGEKDSAATRALALASANSGKTILEDFHIEDTGGAPKMHIGFFNTLHLGSHPQTAVVVDVTLDASEVLLPMIQHWPGWNSSAATLLLRREGRDVIVLDSLHRLPDSAGPLHFSTAEADSIPAQAIQAGTGALTGTGVLNQPVFAYALPVPHTPWTLVAEVGEGDAYAKLNMIAASTTAIVALLMLFSAWWLYEQNHNTIARVRHEAERELLETRINYLAKHANDCIILLNATGGIMEVNDRCPSTYGYAQEELLQMNLSDLHTQENRGEVAQLFHKVTEEFGLIHETEHLRKDGSVFDVEMSTSLIDVDGKPCYQAIIRDISVRKKLQIEREEHMQRLNCLTCRLVSVQEEERRHLSAELHDQVGANLATMNLNLRSIRNMLPTPNPGRLEDMLTETGGLLAETISSIRDYCADLRPAILDYSGLIPALRQLVQRFGRRIDIVTHFREDNMHERLPHQAESMLYRIAQEALTNCAKHSNARSVELVITKRMRSVIMTVSDDGVGFDAQRLVGSSQAGLGLLTMRERAAMAGGELSVISSPGNGTQIRVVVEPHEEEQTIPQQDGENRLGEDQKRLAPMRRLA